MESDFRDAMRDLYDRLRWAENINGCEVIFIVNCEKLFQSGEDLPLFFETVYDKTFRSCEGKKLIYDIEK